MNKYEVNVQIPLVWKRLVKVNNLADASNEKNLTGNDDPNPHYDDVRDIVGKFPNGICFSLELRSGQENYYGECVLGEDGEIEPIDLDSFTDSSSSNDLTIIVDENEQYVFHVEWTGQDPLLTNVQKNDDDFDAFLQDACMKLHDMWTEQGGEEMGANELQSLNDVLTTFFGDKRA